MWRLEEFARSVEMDPFPARDDLARECLDLTTRESSRNRSQGGSTSSSDSQLFVISWPDEGMNDGD